MTQVLIPLDQAIEKIRNLKLEPIPILNLETYGASGRISAQDIVAVRDMPPYHRSAMDGYAVNTEDLRRRGKLRVVARDFPWSVQGELHEGEAHYITTGAPLPRGADAVIRVEASLVKEGYLSSREVPVPMKDVIPAGEDIKKGDQILKRGDIITPYHLGILTAQGFRTVPVFDLTMGIVAIGSELAPFDSPQEGKVTDSISPILMALLSGFGRIKYYGVVEDSLEAVREAIRESVGENYLTLTIGGTSMGEKDFTKKVISELGEVLFEGVSVNILKRGSVGVVRGRPVVILPGQVVSAVTALHEFGLEVLSTAIGGKIARDEMLPLGRTVDTSHRMDTVFLVERRDGGRVFPLRWGVGLYSELPKAVGYIKLKRGVHPEGENVSVRYFL